MVRFTRNKNMVVFTFLAWYRHVGPSHVVHPPYGCDLGPPIKKKSTKLKRKRKKFKETLFQISVITTSHALLIPHLGETF